jgi:cytochrome c553
MRTNRILHVVGVLAISLGLPAVARAGGDAAAGKAKAMACAACHVSDKADDPPHLAGQRATYIAKQLKAFKAGDRKNPLMNAITSALNEADIDNLSAFWSGEKADSDNKPPAGDIAAIRKPKMTFPKDFPKGFTLYSTFNKEAQGLVAKQYINAAGFAAVKAGKPISDGAVIIMVNYLPKVDADKKPVVDKDGIWATDKIKGYEGMEARAGWGKDLPELLRNNTWGYAVFGADKAVNNEVNQAVCLSCHIPAAGNNYVFGVKKMQAAAGAK